MAADFFNSINKNKSIDEVTKVNRKLSSINKNGFSSNKLVGKIKIDIKMLNGRINL